MSTVRRNLLITAAAAALAFGGLTYYAAAHPAPDLAYDLIAAGREVDAIVVYTQQIGADPGNFVLYLRRGVSYDRIGQYERALADLTLAGQLNPNRSTSRSLGARIWQSASPLTHAWTLDMQTHVARAAVLQKLNRFDEALVDLDYAIALNPRHRPALQQRGIVRTLAGRYDEAIADFNAVLAQRPDVHALFARGVAHYLKEDYEAAAADFRAARQRTPNNRKFAEWQIRAERKGARPTLLVEAPHDEESEKESVDVSVFLVADAR